MSNGTNMSSGTNASTVNIPNSPGNANFRSVLRCWGDSETAVAICCSQFGGSRIPLPDSSIPGCAYNESAGFKADDQFATPLNSTNTRWFNCISSHFNSSGGSYPLAVTTCRNTNAEVATLSSTPTISTSTPSQNSGGMVALGMGGQFGRMLIAGILMSSGLLHVSSLAI
ncbi:hypothetical protein B0H10DRAFT_2195967 [Mycena sp. CBHHK59/15]|nr:hypothetical protein B0H10DRAFT_2195967 [Mycena sp. CBHHK59/15]